MASREPSLLRGAFPTPLGTAHAAFDIRGNLVELHVDDQDPDMAAPNDFPALANVRSQVDAWFAGERFDFELPLAPSGTTFQQAVWNILNEIPYAQTLGYGDIAKMLGKPGAARAVGQACGANPIWLVVPCHRVIGAGGHLTGYAGGVGRKDALLRHELLHRRS
jgi:methylated-DNA-[protein]-cysteine S-methyltransferase